MSTNNGHQNGHIDTRLRTLEEVTARLIKPVHGDLIDRLTDQSKAHYVNITTMKDLMDWACGHGRWRATVERVDTPGNHLGMIVRLHIQTEDAGWLYNDGTGHEVTDNPRIYGDPWTNAYAQAFRRAAESFGMVRELWRGKVSKPQIAAVEYLKNAATSTADITKAPPDHEQARVGAEPNDDGLPSRDIRDDMPGGAEAAAPVNSDAPAPAAKGGGSKGGAAGGKAGGGKSGGGGTKAAAPPTGDLATEAQVKAIKTIIRNKYSADADEEARQHFNGRTVAELTQGEAAGWLSALQRSK